MSMQLLGIGTATPPHSIDQQAAATIVQAINGRTEKQRRFIEEVYLHAGVARRFSAVLERDEGPLESRQSFFGSPEERSEFGPTTAERMARYSDSALPLACQAASTALSDARVEANEITHLITVSCTGFHAPGVDLGLMEHLGLSASTARTHIGFMGCHAALNALRTAKAFSESDAAARVLVVCVELCSLHHQYGWSPDQIVANALFADGAAAVVCGRTSTETESGWRLQTSGSAVISDTGGDMSWQIGDHGFAMTLSKRLPDIIRVQLSPWLATWLQQQGLSFGDIGSWAIHPGGPKVISACEDALPLPSSACAPSRQILANYGNMSSATVLFVVDELRRSGAALPCVALAFGPGIAIEAALFV